MERTVRVTITHVRRCRVQVRLTWERCAVCQQQVEVIPAAQAGEMLKACGLSLDALLAAGVVHPIQTLGGRLWVCKESLVLRSEGR